MPYIRRGRARSGQVQLVPGGMACAAASHSGSEPKFALSAAPLLAAFPATAQEAPDVMLESGQLRPEAGIAPVSGE